MTSRHLTISSDDARQTTIVDELTQIEYHIDTPFKWFSRPTTTISKAPCRQQDDHSGLNLDSEIIATIEWHALRATVFHIGNRVVSSRNFIPSREHLSRERHFIGPDMISYFWKLDTGVPSLQVEGSLELYRDDNSDTCIASYKRGEVRVFDTRDPGCLEITPEGEHMIDMIVITFVYVEKLRMDMEARARALASGGTSSP
ncbi:hypothetical protein CONPUDRAFT_166370 [Coniophora puteana RWD-64-598 SS2]|uniref:DUF6593 domain-containing protein n=1 Tax=Coniophora puteana (strain RWD-64-598) TaxID=741705 RepID=A0A5M3MLU8_CONPW|nr:uncharacterized protein CONPUDRAFT_166370 [Coniophora puteana RWD-64-598 SS2]EIW79635.1 hypothetical protein CONPUDRAFT_166370 [Coniophora puteana RWD-64-598 SS2]